jgi:hypothetical protein
MRKLIPLAFLACAALPVISFASAADARLHSTTQAQGQKIVSDTVTYIETRLNQLNAQIAQLENCQQQSALLYISQCHGVQNIDLATHDMVYLPPILVPADVSRGRVMQVKSGNGFLGLGNKNVHLMKYDLSCSWGASRIAATLTNGKMYLQPYVCDAKTVQQWN